MADTRKTMLEEVKIRAQAHGAKVKLAKALGLSRQTIHNKIKQVDGFSDEELSKAAECLGITEQKNTLIAIDPVDARLDEIEARLNEATVVPMDEDDLRAAPVWAETRDELWKIAQDTDVTERQRTRADTFLRLAFSDEAAARRTAQRAADAGVRMRRSRKVCEAAVETLGSQPHPVVFEILLTMTFTYNMEIEDVVRLFDTFRWIVEEAKKPTKTK